MKNAKRLASILVSLSLLAGVSGCTQPGAEQPSPSAAPTAQATPAPSAAPETETPATPDGLSADVLVIGGGLAGAAAALSAQENGASVILIEKQGLLGGSSSYSGGSVGAVGTSVQKEYGIEDSAASWRELWVERSNLSPNENENYPDMARVDWLISQGSGLIDFLTNVGGVPFTKPAGYGVDPVERLHSCVDPKDPEKSGNGGQLMTYLGQTLADNENVTVMLNTKGTALIEENGRIVGAKAEGADGAVEIRAGAVVLATGGFAQNRDLLDRFIPDLPEITCVAAPGATGDGILMAEEVGAQLYDDPWIIGLYTGVGAGSPLNMLPYYAANLYVSPEGKRVMDESQHYALITNSCIAAGGELYMIVDSSVEAIYGQIEAALGDGVYKADTYEELAQAAGIDPDTFVKTMSTYNGYAKTGVDAEFGKNAAALYPVATAPYYAVKVKPNVMGTIGGVETVKTGEVLDTDGRVIPGLYAAGETSNRSIYNQVYLTGSSLAFAATSGRFAGLSAANYAAQDKGSVFSGDAETAALTAMVEELKAKDEISELQSDYWWYMDTKQWEKLGDLFTEDFTYYMKGELICNSRDAYTSYLPQSVDGMITAHQAHQNKIVFTSPTTAEGRWILNGNNLMLANGAVITAYGYYLNDYVKGEDGKWRISEQRLGYFRNEYGDKILGSTYEVPYAETLYVE